MLIVDVPGLMVKLPGSPEAFHAPETLIVDAPRLSTRTADELQLGTDVNVDQVQVVPFVLKVP